MSAATAADTVVNTNMDLILVLGQASPAIPRFTQKHNIIIRYQILRFQVRVTRGSPGRAK